MNNAGRIGFLLKGDYNSDVTYDFLDVVYYNGASYVAKKLTTGNAPERSNEYWQIFAEGGTLTSNGDISDTTVTFTQAENRANVSTGEKMSIFAGKVKKFFSDLKTVAFTGNFGDLLNAPESVNNLESDSTTDFLAAAQGKVLDDKISELNRKSVYGTPLLANDDLNNLINDRYYCASSTDVVISLKNRPPVDAGEMGMLWLPFTPNNRQGMQIAMSKNGNKAYVHMRIKDVSIWSDWNLTQSIT